MKAYATYETDTGKVIGVTRCNDFMMPTEQNIGGGLAIVPVESMDKEIYVENGEVRPKTESPHRTDRPDVLADGQDLYTISNLHIPTTVTLPDGRVIEEIDGSVQFSIDMPGEHIVILDAVPHKRVKLVVTAVNPPQSS